MERRKWTVNNKSVKPQNKRKALSMLREKDWSPEQISAYLLRQKGVSISTQTIYNWIAIDRKNGGDLYTHCRHKLKKRKRTIAAKAGVLHIPDRVSIHQRPKEADEARFGDFEMDLIIGNGKTNLLTITERLTNMIFIAKLEKGKEERK